MDLCVKVQVCRPAILARAFFIWYFALSMLKHAEQYYLACIAPQDQLKMEHPVQGVACLVIYSDFGSPILQMLIDVREKKTCRRPDRMAFAENGATGVFPETSERNRIISSHRYFVFAYLRLSYQTLAVRIVTCTDVYSALLSIMQNRTLLGRRQLSVGFIPSTF